MKIKKHLFSLTTATILLVLLAAAMKLLGLLSISWWYVLAPMLAYWALAALLFIIAFIVTTYREAKEHQDWLRSREELKKIYPDEFK